MLAVQSVRFDCFGALDSAGQPDAAHLVTSLDHRAELRISSEPRRDLFHDVLERHRGLFEPPVVPTLCPDGPQHANVVFRRNHSGWRLAGLLDRDKAWAGPAESDVARMAFWDNMTGPGFRDAYQAAIPEAPAGRSGRWSSSCCGAWSTRSTRSGTTPTRPDSADGWACVRSGEGPDLRSAAVTRPWLRTPSRAGTRPGSTGSRC